MSPCRALALSLLFLSASNLSALDLGRGFPVLQELTWIRSGRDPLGSGAQTLRVIPAGNQPANWPAQLAEAEKTRRRKKNRRAHVWAGFLGTQPSWSVDGEVLQGPPEAPRIRRRLEFWALAPGPTLVHMLADSPGSRGRRRAEKRFLFLLRQLGRLQRGEIRDPFREIRLSGEASHWTEEYLFELPGGLQVRLTGPVPSPLPPLPTSSREKLLWEQYPFQESLPDAPKRFYRGLVPGFLIQFSPTFPSSRQQKFLYNVLGFSSGVGIAETEESDLLESTDQE